MPQDRGGSSADLDRLNDYLETQCRARTDDWVSILRRTVERLDTAFAHFDTILEGVAGWLARLAPPDAGVNT